MRVKLQGSTFYNENETKEKLCNFISQSTILSMSDYCLKTELKFSKKQGRQRSVMVNSGSSANLILIQALLNLGRLKKGDKVAVSALTWSTNIMPLFQLGLIPIIIDCDISTLNVNSGELLLTLDKHPDIRGFFITNALGFCSDIDVIANICKEKNILLLEDNCESLGSVFNGQLLGNFGLASTFSFFVGHHISAIEGGMVCTDDQDLADELVMCRAHGWDRNLPVNLQSKLRAQNDISDFYAKYTFYDLAYNVRPSEINGYLAFLQIDYWDEIVNKRAKNFEAFNSVLSAKPGLLPIQGSNMDLVSNFAVPIIAKETNYALSLRKHLTDIGFETRPMISGSMSRQPFFKKYSSIFSPTTNADLIHENGFYFGNHPELCESDIGFIINALDSY